MFPTFQLNVSGFAICFDLTLLQFVKQLPLEAYTSGADINRTTESIQLPPDPSATPSVAAPSVTADEVLLQDTTKTNFLSQIKGYATKVGRRGRGGRVQCPPINITQSKCAFAVMSHMYMYSVNIIFFTVDKDKASHLGVP